MMPSRRFPSNLPGMILESIVYNVEIFLECEKKDIAAFADRTGPRSIKTGITTAFAGNRIKALEWAIYHHLLGFDHVWMYVNEPWEDGKDLPSTDFLTFIPYNNHLKDIYVGANISMTNMIAQWSEVFRANAQNDALYRASRMGLEWMVFPDLDELVALVTSTLSNATMSNLTATIPSSPALQSYLTDFKLTHGDTYGAIFLQSVLFGRNVQNKSKLELQIDYTWRQKLNLTASHCCTARNKLLLDMRQAPVSVSIHYYIADRRPTIYHPTADELRINHYKRKDEGVFNMKYKYLGPPEILEDTRLRDEYRDRIVQQITSIREGQLV
jgi:hypothetical protein